MLYTNKIIERAKKVGSHVVFPEGEDVRTISAASRLTEKGIAKVTLLGDNDKILQSASNGDINLKNVSIIDPISSEYNNEFAELAFNRLMKKGVSNEEAQEMSKNSLNFGALMVLSGKADACVAGAVNTSADVVRAALRFIGLKENRRTLSSTFLMISPNEDKVYSFGDCGVIPDPTAEQLAEIAVESADSHSVLTGEEAKIAFLSYSTKGSADHERVSKVKNALEIAKKLRPDLEMDGELQFDTAVDETIGASKAKDSGVAGKSNVMIFPDLDSGNIGYKIAQQLGGYTALGPLLQGLKSPMHDLSRGCSADDIVLVAAIAALQSVNNSEIKKEIYADV